MQRLWLTWTTTGKKKHGYPQGLFARLGESMIYYGQIYAEPAGGRPQLVEAGLCAARWAAELLHSAL